MQLIKKQWHFICTVIHIVSLTTPIAKDLPNEVKEILNFVGFHLLLCKESQCLRVI